MAALACTFRLLYSGDATFDRKLDAAEQLVAELLGGAEDGAPAAAVPLPPLVHAHYLRSLLEWACGALTKKSDSASDGKKGKKRKQQAVDAADGGAATAAAATSQPKLQPRCWAVLTAVLASGGTPASQAPPAALLPAATTALQLLHGHQGAADDLVAQVAALLQLLASKFAVSFRPSLEHAAAAGEAALAGHAAAAAAAAGDAAAWTHAAAAAAQLLLAAASGHPNQRKVWDAAVLRLLPLLASAAFPAENSGSSDSELPSRCRCLLEALLFHPQHVAALAAAGAAEMAAAVAEAGGNVDDAKVAGKDESQQQQQPAEQQPGGGAGSYAAQLFEVLRRHVEAEELPLELLTWMAGRFCAAVRQHRRIAETEAAITSQAHGRRAHTAAAEEEDGGGEAAAEGSRAPRPATTAGGLSPLADFHFWLALLRTLQPHVVRLQETAGGSGALAAALSGVAGLADALERHRLYRPTDDPAGHQRLLLQQLADSALALAQQQQQSGSGVDATAARSVLPAALAVLRGILAVEHRVIQSQLPLLWPLLLWVAAGGAGGSNSEGGLAAEVASSLVAAFAELRQLEVLLRSLTVALLRQEAAAGGAAAAAASAVLHGACFQAALAGAVRRLPSGQVPMVLRLAAEGVGQLGSSGNASAGALLLLDVYSCCLASLAVDLTTAATAAVAAQALVAALAVPLLPLLAAAGGGEVQKQAGAGLLPALLRLYRFALEVHGRCAGLHPEVSPLPGRHAQRPRGEAAAPGGYFAPLLQAAGGDAAAPQPAELLAAAGGADGALRLALLQAAEQQLHVRYLQLQYLTHSCPVTLLPAAGGEAGEEASGQQRAAEQQASQERQQRDRQDAEGELAQLAGFLVAAAAEQAAGEGATDDDLAVLRLAAGALPQVQAWAAPTALQALLQACLQGAAAGGGDGMAVRRRRLCCELLGGELLELRQLSAALPAAAAAELGAQLSAVLGGQGAQPEAVGSAKKKRKNERKGCIADGSVGSHGAAVLEQLGRLANGKAVKASAWAAAVEGASPGVVAAAVAGADSNGSSKKRRLQSTGGEPAAAGALLAVQWQAQVLSQLPLVCLQPEAAAGMAAVGMAGVLCCWQGGLARHDLASALPAVCSCLALLARLAECSVGLATQLQLLPQVLHAVLVAAGSAAAAGGVSAAIQQQLAAAAKHSRSVMQAVCAAHLTTPSGGASEMQQLVQRLSQQLAQGAACERWAAAELAEACLAAFCSAASSSDSRVAGDILRGTGASNQQQPALPEAAAAVLGAAAASLEVAVAAALPAAAAAAAGDGSSWQDALLAGSLFAGSVQLLRLRCCDLPAVDELERRQQAGGGCLSGMATGLQAAAGLLERALPGAQQEGVHGDSMVLLAQPLLEYVAACCQVTGRMRPAASLEHYISLLALLLRALARQPAAAGWPVPPARQTLPFAAAFPAAAATVAGGGEQAAASGSARPLLLGALRELVAGSSSQQLLAPLRFAEAALPASIRGGASSVLALPLSELMLVLLEAAAGSRQQRLLGQHSERLALLLTGFVTATAFAPQQAAQQAAAPPSLPQLAAAILAAAEGSSSGSSTSVAVAGSPATAPAAAGAAPAADEVAALCTALRVLESLAARPKLFPLPPATTSSILSCVEAVWTAYAEPQQAEGRVAAAAALPAFRFRMGAASGAGLFAASCNLLMALLRHRQQELRRCLPLMLRTLRALLRFLAAAELSAKLQAEVLAPLAADSGGAVAVLPEPERDRRWRVKCAELLAVVMAELAALKEAGVGRYCPQLLADYLLLAAAPPSARSRALLHYASPAAALAASAGANAAGTVAAAAAAAEEDALAGEPLSAEAGAALRRGAYALYGACSAAEIQFLYASLAGGATGQRGSGSSSSAVASWRAALAALKADYERSYKYTGKSVNSGAMRAQLRACLMLAAVVAATAVAPSLSAPGGLSPDQVPMFVLLTHDDGVDSEARSTMLDVTKGRASADGCQVSATFFVQKDTKGWTACKDVVSVYEKGHEIADHTVSHVTLSGTKKSFVEAEIIGARDKLAACGIPKEDIVGARPPYLNTDVQYRQVLAEHGFLYDSSLIEDWQNSVSQGFGNRVWPWDMSNGNPVNCSIPDVIEDTTQGCSADESYPLWQVPMWRYSNKTWGDKPYTMDPGYSFDCECQNDTFSTYDILKGNFDEAYAGNRAPFPVYIHEYWMKEGNNKADLKKFVDYATGKPDVWFVTMRQLLAWMQNPVPKDQLTPKALGCGNPGGAPGSLAGSGGGSGGN